MGGTLRTKFDGVELICGAKIVEKEMRHGCWHILLDCKNYPIGAKEKVYDYLNLNVSLNNEVLMYRAILAAIDMMDKKMGSAFSEIILKKYFNDQLWGDSEL